MFPVSESKRSAASQPWCLRRQSVTPLASFEHKWSCHCTFRQVALLPWKQTDYLLYNSFSENTTILRRPSYVHEANDRFHMRGCFSSPHLSPIQFFFFFFFFIFATLATPARRCLDQRCFHAEIWIHEESHGHSVQLLHSAHSEIWLPHLHYRLLYNTVKTTTASGGGVCSRLCSLTTH